MTTVTAAVAKRDTGPGAVISNAAADFAAVLPSHVRPQTFVRVAQGVVRRDPKLLEACTNDGCVSLMVALLDAARQGLEPGTEQYYLVPRKRKGRLEVQGIRGYQGEIELIYRSGAVSSVIVEVVRTRDRFTYLPGRDDKPLHEIDWDAADRGALRLAYAYAVMKDGATSKVVVLNRAHIDEAKASSDGAGSEYSPWIKHEEAMWLKTAAHRLYKWVPSSAEYRHHAGSEQHRPAEIPQAERYAQMTAPEPVYDAEVIDDLPSSAAVTPPDSSAAADVPGPDEPHPPAAADGPPVAAAPGPGTPRKPLSKTTLGKLVNTLQSLPLGEGDAVMEVVSAIAGHPVQMVEVLTADEAGQVIAACERALSDADGDTEQAAALLWTAVRAAQEAPDG